MAGQAITLGELKNRAIYRADLEGLSDRHPAVDLNAEANATWRDFRVRLANNDVWAVLTPTAVAALPTTQPFSGAGYVEIDWPTDAVSVHGIDANFSGDWCNIPQGTFTNRRLGRSLEHSIYAHPSDSMQWILRSLPTASGSVVSPGKVILTPPPGGGNYIMWYLPEWNDIILDTDVFPCLEGWSSYLIWDLARKILIRDIGPQASAQLQYADAELAKAWSEIRPNLQRAASDGPIEVPNRYNASRYYGRRLVP